MISHQSEHRLLYHNALYKCDKCRVSFESPTHEESHLRECGPLAEESPPKRQHLHTGEEHLQLPEFQFSEEPPPVQSEPMATPMETNQIFPGIEELESWFGLTEELDYFDFDDDDEHSQPAQNENPNDIFNSMEEYLLYLFYQQEGGNR